MPIDVRRIRELRKVHGWSQEDLAKKIHSSQQSITDWETAKKLPNLVALSECADAFHVSVDYLLGRTDCPYTVYSSSVENGEVVCFTTKKEASAEAEAQQVIAADFSIDDDALPKNRQELEQLVESLLRKALSGQK